MHSRVLPPGSSFQRIFAQVPDWESDIYARRYNVLLSGNLNSCLT